MSDARVAAPLLEVQHLSKRFLRRGGIASRREEVHAVEDVSFSVGKGETLGLVGESGCGKSTTARMVVRTVRPTAGVIRFDGDDITALRRGAMRRRRGEIQMIFQDPYASLNPRHSVGQILSTPFAVRHTGLSSAEIRTKVRDLMDRVGLNPEHYNRYPHEFSGGQRQRIGIARALAPSPRLIVCDEPVSALDVSVQAQILNLLQDLQSELGLTYLFISHNLRVIRHVSSRIAVMYLGRIVEVGDAVAVYEAPRHPYTAALLSAIPSGIDEAGGERIVLRGDVPSPVNPPTGCPFHPRCPKARMLADADGRDAVPDACRDKRPVMGSRADEPQVACHYPLVAGELTSLPMGA